jgi:hypothetical protein
LTLEVKVKGKNYMIVRIVICVVLLGHIVVILYILRRSYVLSIFFISERVSLAFLINTATKKYTNYCILKPKESMFKLHEYQTGKFVHCPMCVQFGEIVPHVRNVKQFVVRLFAHMVLGSWRNICAHTHV